MSALTVAGEQYRQQVALARRIAAETARLWRLLEPANLDTSWMRVSDRMLALVVGGQQLAAGTADSYLAAILDAQDINPAAAGSVNGRALAGVASDGRELATLMYEPVIATKTAIGRGAAPEQALGSGLSTLDMIVRTQIADAGRVAVGIGIAARRHVGGYVRMLNPPSCSRCLVLAGKWFKWNQGFRRHPRCDCVHIPSSEDRSGDLKTNPYRYLESVDQAERERILGKAGAKAIEDGADISQVVNARRGMQTANVFGQQSLITSEGTTTRGLAGMRLGAREGATSVTSNTAEGIERTLTRAKAPRLMPEQIYADAEKFGLTREQTLEVLRRHAYII